MKITIKANKFNFEQVAEKKINIYVKDLENIVDNDKTIINYNLVLSVEDIPNAIIKYKLFNTDKNGYAINIKPVSALQLNAIGILKKEKINGIDTGMVEIDTDEIRKKIGTHYQAKLHIVEGYDSEKEKKYNWYFIIPIKADTAILTQIMQAIEEKKNK